MSTKTPAKGGPADHGLTRDHVDDLLQVFGDRTEFDVLERQAQAVRVKKRDVSALVRKPALSAEEAGNLYEMSEDLDSLTGMALLAFDDVYADEQLTPVQTDYSIIRSLYPDNAPPKSSWSAATKLANRFFNLKAELSETWNFAKVQKQGAADLLQAYRLSRVPAPSQALPTPPQFHPDGSESTTARNLSQDFVENIASVRQTQRTALEEIKQIYAANLSFETADTRRSKKAAAKAMETPPETPETDQLSARLAALEAAMFNGRLAGSGNPALAEEREMRLTAIYKHELPENDNARVKALLTQLFDSGFEVSNRELLSKIKSQFPALDGLMLDKFRGEYALLVRRAAAP